MEPRIKIQTSPICQKIWPSDPSQHSAVGNCGSEEDEKKGGLTRIDGDLNSSGSKIAYVVKLCKKDEKNWYKFDRDRNLYKNISYPVKLRGKAIHTSKMATTHCTPCWSLICNKNGAQRKPKMKILKIPLNFSNNNFAFRKHSHPSIT